MDFYLDQRQRWIRSEQVRQEIVGQVAGVLDDRKPDRHYLGLDAYRHITHSRALVVAMKNLTWLIHELTTLKNTYGECQVGLQPIEYRDDEDHLLEETDVIEKGKRYILEL